MIIKYQKQLEEQISKGLTQTPYLGITEEQISLLEAEMCPVQYPEFPRALREFLFLAGARFSNFSSGLITISDNPTSLDINELMDEHRYYRKLYKNESKPLGSYDNWSLDPFQGRPYWGFYPMDSNSAFMFIFLDEGVNDPPVWCFYLTDDYDVTDPEFEFFELVTDRLSHFISEYVPNYIP